MLDNILKIIGILLVIIGTVGLWQYDLGTNEFISSQLYMCIGGLFTLLSQH